MSRLVPTSSADEKSLSITAREIAVMVVEDDTAIADAVRDMLTEHGYSTVAAANGALGLALLRNGLRPRVIMLDLMMPVMNGWEFRTHQRNDPALKDIPIIVMTAGEFRTADLQAELGDVTIVRKPAQPDSILAALSRLLARARQRASPADRSTPCANPSVRAVSDPRGSR